MKKTGVAPETLQVPDGGSRPGNGGLPDEDLAALPYREAVLVARDRISRDYLAALLRAHEGNVTQAAQQAGMERESLHRLLRRYGIRSEDFKRR